MTRVYWEQPEVAWKGCHQKVHPGIKNRRWSASTQITFYSTSTVTRRWYITYQLSDLLRKKSGHIWWGNKKEQEKLARFWICVLRRHVLWPTTFRWNGHCNHFKKVNFFLTSALEHFIFFTQCTSTIWWQIDGTGIRLFWREKLSTWWDKHEIHNWN